MGRYLEKKCKLPGNPNFLHFVPSKMSEQSGAAVQINDDSGILYSLKQDGSWKKESCDWLEASGIAEQSNYLLFDAGDDQQTYALIASWGNEDDSPSLKVYQKDDKKAKPISLPDLEATDISNGSPDVFPCNYHFFKDQSSVFVFFDHVSAYTSAGKCNYEIPNVIGCSSTFVNNKLYIINSTTDSVDVYDTTTGKLLSNIRLGKLAEKYPDNTYHTGILCSDSKGTIYYENQTGVHTLKDGCTTWESTIDGSLNSLCSSSTTGLAFMKASNGCFYWIGEKDMRTQYNIYEYKYDANTPAIPDKTLKIYSLPTISAIDEGISLFLSSHPDVKIEYSPAISGNGSDSNLTSADYVKALNTQIISGDSPDILFVDGLNGNTYIEKGILKDLSKVAAPELKAGNLYPNIIDNLKKDGKLYFIPIRLQVPILCGTKDAMKASDSLEDLAAFAESSDKPVFAGDYPISFCQMMFAIYNKELFNDSGSIDVSKLDPFLTNLKTIYDHSKYIAGNDDNYVFSPSICNLIDKSSSLGFDNVHDIRSEQEILQQIKNSGYDYDSFCQTFLPAGCACIMKNSKQQDLAAEFITFLLGKEAQSADTKTGLPMNPHCVPQKQLTYNPYGSQGICAYDYTSVNGKQHIDVHWPTKKQVEKFSNLYSNLSNTTSNDYELEDTLLDAINGYITGSVSKEKTLNQITSFLDLYNKE